MTGPKEERYQRIYIEETWSIFDQYRSVISHPEVRLTNKPLIKKNIGEALKVPQRQLWQEDLFLKYYKNKNISLTWYLIPIKYLPDGTKVLHSVIAQIIKEGYYSDAWEFVAHQCANGISKIQGVDFDHSYGPVSHT